MKIFGAGVLIVSGVLAAAVPAAAKSELILAIGGEPDTGYDPLLGWGRYGHPLFQSTLLKRDAALETVPDLASARSLSDDRLVWTVTLRPGVTFSDGTPLSAAGAGVLKSIGTSLRHGCATPCPYPECASGTYVSTRS